MYFGPISRLVKFYKPATGLEYIIMNLITFFYFPVKTKILHEIKNFKITHS